MTPDEIAAAVDGYRVIRSSGAVYVQARIASERDRLEALGAVCTTTIEGSPPWFVMNLAPMLEAPEPDEEGNVTDNRVAILRAYFAERDGTSWPSAPTLRAVE